MSFHMRLPATDNPITGLSSFQLESKELGKILSTTMMNSLVLTDEIGRSTGNAESVSFNKALVDELHDRNVFSIIATHCFEVLDHNVSTKNITMTLDYKLSEGFTTTSNAMCVVQASGFPKKFVENMRSYLGGNVTEKVVMSEKESQGFMEAVEVAQRIVVSPPHMVGADSAVPAFLLAVYVIEENDSSIYVGETLNVSTRQGPTCTKIRSIWKDGDVLG